MSFVGMFENLITPSACQAQIRRLLRPDDALGHHPRRTQNILVNHTRH